MQKSLSRRERAVDLMLDSGAFGAWKQGIDINVREYGEFLQRNAALLYSYVNLDVIPGGPGRRATMTEVEDAAKRSLKNYNTLRRMGLNPIPVFHYGETLDWFHRILDCGADYIGLGGSAKLPSVVRGPWFERCFADLRRLRRENLRVHGFGCTVGKVIHRYGWFSVDSTSWALAGATGTIYLPRVSADGEFDYTRLSTMRVSGQGSPRGQLEYFHVGRSDIVVDHVGRYLATLGFSPFDARNSRDARLSINAAAMVRMSEVLGKAIFLATWMDDQGKQLTQIKARRRLLSYLEVGPAESFLEEYVTNGFVQAPPTPGMISSGRIVRRGQALARRVEVD